MPLSERLLIEPIFIFNAHRWSCREVLFRNLFVFGAVFIALHFLKPLIDVVSKMRADRKAG